MASYIRLYTTVRKRGPGGTVARSAIRVSCAGGRSSLYLCLSSRRAEGRWIFSYCATRGVFAARRVPGEGERAQEGERVWNSSALNGFVGNARLRQVSRETDVGRARRRLDVTTSGARDVGGASTAPPIERSRRGIFILLFTPRTEKNGSPVQPPAVSRSRSRGTWLRPARARSPYVARRSRRGHSRFGIR